MTAPWKSAPAPSSQFSTANYTGELLFVAVGGVHEHFSLNGNNVPAARTNIVVLSGPEQGREWTDALLFGVITVDQCRAAIAEATKQGQQGSLILGRVGTRRGSNARDMYYLDSEVAPYDEQIAQSWDAAYPGKLAQLQRDAVTMFQAEEIKLNGGRAQAAPPPPPPAPPAAPPAPPAFPPPPPPQPAQGVQSSPPPWGSPTASGSQDTPPY